MEEEEEVASDNSYNSESDPGHGYYGGRVIRVPEHKALYSDVLSKLSADTVKVFLAWFYQYLAIYLNSSKTSLPGNIFIS